ncbi:hypothetical protein [Psychroserpens damuponensis]|uniref:hypothetical protein n=1 Tax=Psychroserpens damuponensis TaxID=943936 RepID=UPI00058BA5A0|nr:hypothetical protein [Psychroserpens damuponensis]
MKKIILTFVFIFSLATVFTSCRDEKTPEEKVEAAMDDVKDDVEDASDDVQDAADDLAEEIEEAAEDNQ